jgi:hypothetical protein
VLSDDPLVLLVLVAVAGIAGLVDAIAGGGGLLTVPALLLAGLPPHVALATNKGQSVFGAAAALARYARSPLLDRERAPAGFCAGLLGAVAGVLLVQAIAPVVLRPLILVLLVAAVAVVIGVRPPQAGERRARPLALTVLVAGAIGAYDGFFGPGTGTFLILAGTLLWRTPYDAASADAKVVNFASNLGALAVFAVHGQVLWAVALAMGTAQLAGGWLGAHLVVRRGAGLVRMVVVLVGLALIARLAWGLWRG